jgi:hypothetical protein
MKIQDFKFLIAITFIVLLLLWFVCTFFAISYEDGTNNSFFSKFSFNVAKLIIFSFYFWYKFLNTFFALIFALFCSALIFSTFVYIITNLKKTINKTT